MMMKGDWGPGIAIAGAYLTSVVMYPDLPDVSLRTPWPSALTRPAIAFALPTAATVTYLILRNLWTEVTVDRPVDPGGLSETIHRAIAVRVVLFVAAIHVLVLLNVGGVLWIRAWTPRLVLVLFGGVCIAVGNLLPRTRPNLALGIRTARTLSDRQLWSRVHRICGYVAVTLGTVIVVAGLFLSDPALELVVGSAALASISTLVVTYFRQCHA
jgi:uncharacterized membrane protein